VSAGFSDPVLAGSPTSPPTGVPTTDEPSMKDKATESAQVGKQAAGEVAQTATDKAKDVAQEAKSQARNVVGQAQDQLREQAANQHRNLVSNLHSLGDQLNSMADRSEQSGQATDLVAEAGSRAHSVASWLDEREPGQLLDELRSFARRKPGVFVIGALAAGVVAGRLTRGVVAVHQDDGHGDGHSDGHSDVAGQQPFEASSGYGDTQASYYSTSATYTDAGAYASTPTGEPYQAAYPSDAATAAEPGMGGYPSNLTSEERP
jgi:hypothetical protein